SAVASAFLQFRATLTEDAENLVNKALEQQINQAEQTVKSIDAQIERVSAQPATTAGDTKLKKLRTEANQVSLGVSSLQSTEPANAAAAQVATDTIVQDSRTLNPAVLTPPHSKFK